MHNDDFEKYKHNDVFLELSLDSIVRLPMPLLSPLSVGYAIENLFGNSIWITSFPVVDA